PVHAGRASTALDVAEDGNPHVVMGETFLDAVGYGKGAGFVAFGYNNDAGGLVLPGTVQPGHHGLIVHFGFRYEDALGADTDARPQGDEAGVAAHYFHHKNAVVRLGGITDFVDRFDNGIDGRVVT